MDTRALQAAGGGRVVVAALAGATGHEYDTATANGVRYYRGLGAGDVVGAPDARLDEAGAYAACRSARLLVLPGGSPARLLEALTTTRVGDAVHEVLDRGGVVSGASAGAMVLCRWTVLPEGGTPRVVPGLGIVPWAVVVPHWRGGSRWVDAITAAVQSSAHDDTAPDDAGSDHAGSDHAGSDDAGPLALLGLPEQSGLLVAGTSYEGLGAAATHVVDLTTGAAYDVSPLARGTWPPAPRRSAAASP